MITPDHLILTAENALAFERSINFLQQALTEFRRISLGMMPELLYTYGLDEAMRQKCAEISREKNIQVNYHSTGLEGKILSPELSVAVYRIIEDLLGNFRRSASAERIELQLSQTDGKLQIHVHDNREGLEPTGWGNVKWSGLQNIQYRVESIKGNMHVDSEEGAGTRVHIAFQL